MSRPRTNDISVLRTVGIAVARTVKWADSGLLHRLWVDIRWREKRIYTKNGAVDVGVGQALVSVASYSREAGCSRNTIADGLRRLASAGWINIVEKRVAGYLVECVVNPLTGEHCAEFRPLGGAQNQSRGMLKTRAGGCLKPEQGDAPELSTTVPTPSVPTPTGPTPTATGADVDLGFLEPPRTRAFDPAASIEGWPVWRGPLQRAGIDPGQVFNELQKGREPYQVLGWVLYLAEHRKDSAAAYLADLLAECKWPRQRFIGHAQSLLSPWFGQRRMAGVREWGDPSYNPDRETELIGPVLERTLAKMLKERRA